MTCASRWSVATKLSKWPRESISSYTSELGYVAWTYWVLHLTRVHIFHTLPWHETRLKTYILWQKTCPCRASLSANHSPIVGMGAYCTGATCHTVQSIRTLLIQKWLRPVHFTLLVLDKVGKRSELATTDPSWTVENRLSLYKVS